MHTLLAYYCNWHEVFVRWDWYIIGWETI